ncbi:MAG: histidinol dehydrogenase [Elusimicrobia bacterium]|nr:histidinol dehydrogenase [Elusimicrobiota bacterium]
MGRIEKKRIFSEDIIKRVKDIAKNISKHGDAALAEYTLKFDGVNITESDIEVKKEEWKETAGKIHPEIKDVIDRAAGNIKKYAESQNIYKNREYTNGGMRITDKYIPIEKVGVYVPGGNYSYPSTVMMCVIPARVAGVKEIVMVTPPGNLTPAVMYAARISGVDRVFRLGGAQAVLALGYGWARSVPSVDMIVGPGNVYVQCAKMLVSDVVGIDMISGPSEVCIIADGKQDPGLIAVDMMAQFEHAADAKAVLISDSKKLIEEVQEEIAGLKILGKARFEGVIEYAPVDGLDAAVDKANEIAPEHLQIMCSRENIRKIESGIKNAGAVFIGRNTPVAIGDYWAGPSHALPTGGTARFSEGLNVGTFMKKVSFINCSEESVREAAGQIEKLAQEEGMNYHAESVRKRLDNS